MATKRTPKQPLWESSLSWGTFQKEILAIVLIGLGVLTLLSLLSVTRGALSDGWVAILRQIFGLGAFVLVVAAILAGILLLFRRGLLSRLGISWVNVVGAEVVFLATLGLLHLGVPGEDPLILAQTGSGGGYIGYTVSNVLAQLAGYEAAAVLLIAFIVLGLTILFPAAPAEVWGALRQAAAWGQAQASLLLGRTARAGQGSSRAVRTRRPRREAEEPPVLPGEPALKAARVPATRKATEARPATGPAVSKAPETKARQEGRLPTLEILKRGAPRYVEDSEIRRRAKVIEETLESFGLPVKVVEINRGPAVTQYGVEPGLIERKARDGEVAYSRVRVSKISALVNDLALALAAAPIRIEAPVPGRSMVGIEVPNEEISVVSLRTIMESETFGRLKSRLKIALGQDVSGRAVVADLATMPHLLIAGATGSGKSVCINAVICSLLFNNTPEQLRLLLVDPKMVELTNYNGIPHLLAPVVIQTDQVVGALTWMTRQMDERYRLFSQNRVRNVEEYNSKVGRKAEGGELPYIVLVIDELADLMMAAPEDVEWAICRIAQMARATGIHLILATQRPSVDVVTGLIKANFPARISFAVTSQIDSRVIIDMAGAEALLGRGDMLYVASDAPRPVRVQGCYVSDREIEDLVEFWRRAAPAQPSEPEPQYPWSDLMAEEDRDELLDQAIELVQQNGRASASFLQRRLRIGYPRAARLMDQLEEEGIIRPAEDGSRNRAVTEREGRWEAEMEQELGTEDQ